MHHVHLPPKIKIMLRVYGLVLVLVCLSNVGFSQKDPAIDSAAAEMVEEDKVKHQDLFYIDLNWDRLLGVSAPIEQKWFGRGIGLGLLYDQPLNKNGNVSVAAGVGFTSHNYYMNSVATRFNGPNNGYTDFSIVGDSVYTRGKISVNYVDIPFELRFRLNPDKNGNRWKLALGGKVGYKIQAHEKIINNQDIKIKTYDYPHITRLRYGLSGRVGYGSIMLSAFYSLTPFFDENHSINQYNTFTLGVTIVPF
ncbi:MAG TPA: hypothetical protein DCR48_11195 [Flavobacteriales bacterium]|nr:hypothetical protein [Flavobacteriales bacterium]